MLLNTLEAMRVSSLSLVISGGNCNRCWWKNSFAACIALVGRGAVISKGLGSIDETVEVDCWFCCFDTNEESIRSDLVASIGLNTVLGLCDSKVAILSMRESLVVRKSVDVGRDLFAGVDSVGC